MKDDKLIASLRHMMILSSLMIAVFAILFEYVQELGYDVSIRILLDLAIFPALYMASYLVFLRARPFEKQKHLKQRKKYFEIISGLTQVIVLILVSFLLVMFSLDFWIKHEILGDALILIVRILFVSAAAIFGLMLSYATYVWRH